MEKELPAEKDLQIKEKRELILKGVGCPMTFVKTKLALSGLEAGNVLEIVIDNDAAFKDMPEALKYEGHQILRIEEEEKGVWKIVVQKGKKK